MTDMKEIDKLCRGYSAAREKLGAIVDEVRAAQRRAVRQRRRDLTTRAAAVSAARDNLRTAVAARPDLFERPRTLAIEGVKVGYRKRPGRIECDEARTLALIDKRCPERRAALVRVKTTLVRAALKNLDAKTLASIGVAIVDPDDEIVIAAAADDLDALVDALLSDLDDYEQAA